MFSMFIYLFIFIFGISIGSFLNVLIDRLPYEKKITGRSYCDHCRRRLFWYQLVPIISYLFLRGKCGFCHKKISLYYPLVEFLTGVMFIFVFLSLSPFDKLNYHFKIWQLIGYWGIIACLIVVFFADLKYHLIPDQIQITLFIFGLILLPFHGQSLPWLFVNRSLAALAVAAPIFFLHWVSTGRAMGFGDVKLGFNVGFLLGIKAGFLALYLAFVLGGFVGLLLILLGRKKMKSKIAFGPFIVIGAVLMLFYGRELLGMIEKIYGF